MDEPSAMQWLDLSFNQLTCIEDVILKYPNIRVSRIVAYRRLACSFIALDRGVEGYVIYLGRPTS